MKKLIYPACFYPNDSGGYTVDIPDMPGCVTEGTDFSNAIEMAVDAASGWVLDCIEDGEEIPISTMDIKKINCSEDDGIVNFIVLDINDYAEKHGSKHVRKNCTIPAWLNAAAEKENVNFSQTLQNALIDYLHINK